MLFITLTHSKTVPLMFLFFFFHSILITASFYGSVQHMETRVKLNYHSFGIPPSLNPCSEHFSHFSCIVDLPSWPYLLLWTTSTQHHIFACRTIWGHNGVCVLQIHSRCDVHFIEQTWFLNTYLYRNTYTAETQDTFCMMQDAFWSSKCF